MSHDPRLRLLGDRTAGSGAEAALRRLDETTVIVRVDPGADRATLVAVAAFVGITARLFPRIAVHCPNDLPANWWGATSWDELLLRLAAVRPTTAIAHAREVAVGFGTVHDSCNLYVGGGDWDVVLDVSPVALEAGCEHALGVHAGACLAVSQVLHLVLGDVGFPGVEVTGKVTTNLIDHSLGSAPTVPTRAVQSRTHVRPVEVRPNEPADGPPMRLAFAGVGSVGTSALALLAGICSPVLSPGRRLVNAIHVTAIDSDSFDPDRNPYRYPALIGDETAHKADWVTGRLRTLGIDAHASGTSVASWNRFKAEPGWDGVLVSSVDTIAGRLDVADVLARWTLSAGVAGTAFHVQWEQFADGYACPFCDFVRADPPTTQAGVYAQLTGLPIARILTLLQDGAVMDHADVDAAIAAGRLGTHRRDAIVGAPLSDLVRQAYAEAELRGPASQAEPEVVAVAAPQVSWLVGVVIAAEIVKDRLQLPLLHRRVDLDASGLPAGLVRAMPADGSTCLCRSGTRIHWYRTLYGIAASPPTGSAGWSVKAPIIDG